MTAEEKAKELTEQFSHQLYGEEFATDDKWVKCIELAQITVNNIIKAVGTMKISSQGYYSSFSTQITYGESYWQEVKKEINKL